MDSASQADAATQAPVWRFLLWPRWVGWHLLMVISVTGMGWLGDWQLHRALSGNALSWAYTFEWPLFAGFAALFWAKTIRDEFRVRRGVMPDPRAAAAETLPPDIAGAVPAAAAVQGAAAPGDDEDSELSAYNAYLARLNAEVKSHGRWHGLR